MAVLKTKDRKKLKSSTFGLPAERKYPMPDKAHAANAKARATQMVKKGKLSKVEEEKIDRKADKILGKGQIKKTKSTLKEVIKRSTPSKSTLSRQKRMAV